MPDLTTFHAPGSDLIEDGYPSEAAIRLIKTWTATPRALVADVLEPLCSAYGSVTVEEVVDDLGRDVMRVRIVTGGWSGNEEVIGALTKGMFGFAWWISDKRGGSHVYEVPTTLWETDMYEWPEMPTAYTRGFDRAAEVTRAELNEIRGVDGLPAAALAIVERLEAFLLEGSGE